MMYQPLTRLVLGALLLAGCADEPDFFAPDLYSVGEMRVQDNVLYVAYHNQVAAVVGEWDERVDLLEDYLPYDSDPPRYTALAVEGDEVYGILEDHILQRAHINDGTQERLRGLAVPYRSPHIGLNRDYMFYAEYGIFKMSRTSRERVRLDSDGIVRDMVANDDWLVLRESTEDTGWRHQITSYNLASGELTVLAENLVDEYEELVLHDGVVYWTSTPSLSSEADPDSGQDDSGIYFAPVAGGDVQVVARDHAPTRIAVDASYIYFIDKLHSGSDDEETAGMGSIWRVNKNLPLAEPELLAADQPVPVSIAVTEDALYWGNQGLAKCFDRLTEPQASIRKMSLYP